MSLTLASLFRSIPSNVWIGSADRKMKKGETWMPQGAWMTALSDTRCRASVRAVGP
jgi:hypothetical protein